MLRRKFIEIALFTNCRIFHHKFAYKVKKRIYIPKKLPLLQIELLKKENQSKSKNNVTHLDASVA